MTKDSATATPERGLAKADGKAPDNAMKGKVATMEDLIAKYKDHMQALLPQKVSVERIFRVTMLAMGRQPKLLECTAASILGAVLESVRLGLEPGAGAGETWLVPYKNRRTGRMECQLILDYRAIIKLMKRDAGVSAVFVDAVHEGDLFVYGVDGVPTLKWTPAPQSQRGKCLGYFAASWDTHRQMTGVVYMTMDEINKFHRARSMAKDSGPWQTDEAAMCRKTVIRPLAKLNPGTAGTTELQRAVALDERAQLGKPQDLALLVSPEEQPTPEEETYADPEPTSGPASPTQEAGNQPGRPKAAQPAPAQQAIQVASMGKTEVDGKVVTVVRLVGHDKLKLYTDADGMASLCAKALKAREQGTPGSWLTLEWTARGGKDWLVQGEPLQEPKAEAAA